MNIIGSFHDLRRIGAYEEKPNTKFTEDMYSLIQLLASMAFHFLSVVPCMWISNLDVEAIFITLLKGRGLSCRPLLVMTA